MRRILLLLVVLSAGASAGAQVVFQDGFESGGVSTGWGLTSGVAVQADGGAAGTGHFARLAAAADLAASVANLVPSGAQEFYVDGYFRIQATTQRQFNFQFSDSTGVISDGAATVNLRVQSGSWAAYDGSTWQPIAGLGSVTTNQWYHARVGGQGWGTGSARWSLAVSGAGVTNFTSFATNLTWFQHGIPSSDTAQFFVFTTVYGSSPGFDVDEVTAVVTVPTPQPPVTNAILNISGTYPHLAVFNNDGEIGIGAVASWAGRLWFLTYPPSAPNGSPDKLWTVDTNLTLAARPESVGGTHANRMIQPEWQQLIIGPYFIDTNAVVRVVAPSIMPGRLTAVARGLTDPTNHVYFFTMEKGLYDVDMRTLAVTTIYRDGNASNAYPLAPYPGAHGKGGYTGQGMILFADNGEPNWSYANDPGFNGPSGVLTENAGANWAVPWTTVERREFTEITGPGGLSGSTNTSDPIWSLGWDKRSVILKLRDSGNWHTYRLPKASYTHDAMTGWYTEWPRIREIVDGRLLMHMHGLFYTFPKTFTAADTAGIQPICTFLKMPVDYCWWNGQIVMGRDDASMTEADGSKWNGQSNSGLWFGQWGDLAKWGAPAGFGGPWDQDAVTAGTPSDPFLMTGFSRRIVHVRQGNGAPVNFAVQCDTSGTGDWQTLTNLAVPANGYAWCVIPTTVNAVWARLVPDQSATKVTAYFDLGNPPTPVDPGLFAGLAEARPGNGCSDGIIRTAQGNAQILQFAANMLDTNGNLAGTGYYEINGAFQLARTTNAAAEATLRATYALSNADFTLDAASIIYTENGTNRFRLPPGPSAYQAPFASGWPRGRREVVTERFLFDAGGTFYEVPRSDAGGFRRVRPVATHQKHISDFASWRGLLALAGVAAGATNDGHVFRSDDGQAALWFGNVDDLWRLGAPVGVGGPWSHSVVAANIPSDPYLMYGYDRKVLRLSHTNAAAVTFTVEVDFTADGTWSPYARFTVAPGQTLSHVFPAGYSAHWVRVTSDTPTAATATFVYGPAAPQITGVAVQSGGGLQIIFTGSAGQSYTVRASSDVTTPLTNWVALATGTFGTNTASFLDGNTTAGPRRFYTISMP